MDDVHRLTPNLKKGDKSTALGIPWGGTPKLDAESGRVDHARAELMPEDLGTGGFGMPIPITSGILCQSDVAGYAVFNFQHDG